MNNPGQPISKLNYETVRQVIQPKFGSASKGMTSSDKLSYTRIAHLIENNPILRSRKPSTPHTPQHPLAEGAEALQGLVQANRSYSGPALSVGKSSITVILE